MSVWDASGSLNLLHLIFWPENGRQTGRSTPRVQVTQGPRHPSRSPNRQAGRAGCQGRHVRRGPASQDETSPATAKLSLRFGSIGLGSVPVRRPGVHSEMDFCFSSSRLLIHTLPWHRKKGETLFTGGVGGGGWTFFVEGKVLTFCFRLWLKKTTLLCSLYLLFKPVCSISISIFLLSFLILLPNLRRVCVCVGSCTAFTFFSLSCCTFQPQPDRMILVEQDFLQTNSCWTSFLPNFDSLRTIRMLNVDNDLLKHFVPLLLGLKLNVGLLGGWGVGRAGGGLHLSGVNVVQT